MNRIHLATSALTTALLSICLISNSYATSPKTKAPTNDGKAQVTVEGTNSTSQEEIATVDVLNEICPAILGTNNTKNFHKGYSNLISSMLPIKYPVEAVAAMHNDPEYMKIYSDARTQALAQKPEDNRDVCLDVLHYESKKGTGKKGAAAAH